METDYEIQDLKKKEKKKVMHILIDDREPLLFHEVLKDISTRKRLLVGDYICEDVCIERKEINDLCGSIKDKRLIHQVENMKQNFKHNYVIITGHIEDRISQIHENCILGKISSLLVKHKVPVLMVDNDVQFLYLIKSIFEKHLNIMKGGGNDGSI